MVRIAAGCRHSELDNTAVSEERKPFSQPLLWQADNNDVGVGTSLNPIGPLSWTYGLSQCEDIRSDMTPKSVVRIGALFWTLSLCTSGVYCFGTCRQDPFAASHFCGLPYILSNFQGRHLGISSRFQEHHMGIRPVAIAIIPAPRNGI